MLCCNEEEVLLTRVHKTFLLHVSSINEEQTKFVLEKSRQMCQLVTYHPVKRRKIERKETGTRIITETY
jgi:hypothetical protein